eukprot:gene55037-75404_t
MVFGDGWAGSASFTDGGVRLKRITFDPGKWDFIDLPEHLKPAARAWFDQHAGSPYDLLGNLQFILAPFGQAEDHWFCSEACAAALGIIEPGRYDPGTLASALTLISLQPASAAITPSAAGASSEQRIDRLAAYVEQLSADLHALKGNLAANTAITQDVATGQDAVKALLAKINVEKIIELVDAVDSMRGGIKVLGWLERPAKWIAAIGAAVAAVLRKAWSVKFNIAATAFG